MIMRMLGAARLNVHTFEEVEKDTSATTQALIVVALVSIAGGVGGLLGGEDVDILRGLVYGVVGGVVWWAVWALVTMFVGTKLLKTEETEADWGQLARTTGFAQTPGLLNVLSFISGVGGFILLLDVLVAVGGHGDRRPASPGLHVDAESAVRGRDIWYSGAHHLRAHSLGAATLGRSQESPSPTVPSMRGQG